LKRLKDVLPPYLSHKVIGDDATIIAGIQLDSRLVNKGDVFVAIKGFASDGHNYVESAIAKGATVVVVENETVYEGPVTVQTSDTREMLGLMAASYYDMPSHQLKLIGVTGTNGKTSVATMLFDLYQMLGYKVGLISTIENKIHQEVTESSHTTPDAVKLSRLLSKMVDAACDYVFMEVSSHAIDQKRIAGQKFTGGIFTNITRDHLGYHSSFKEYIDVKKKFFDLLDDDAFAVVNIDDKHGEYMVQNTKATTYRYSLRTLVDYKTKVLANNLNGLYLQINEHELHTMFIGDFNAYNITAVFAVADVLGSNKHEVLQAISGLLPAEGRFDVMKGELKNIYAIVDYAHTPDALKNVLSTLNGLKNQSRIITVIGCGGNRDKGKRPIMAEIACRYSDQVVLTSDNPRDEDPLVILSDMENGIKESDMKKVLIIENRKQAIKTAVSMATENDVVLVAGKGHEKYQEIKGKKIPFDDKLILKAFLL